nr:MAG TPA: hypothetical protein [Caudoviricetes sp.]
MKSKVNTLTFFMLCIDFTKNRNRVESIIRRPFLI